MFLSHIWLFSLPPPLILQSFNVIKDHPTHSLTLGVHGAHYPFKVPHHPLFHHIVIPSPFLPPNSTTIVLLLPGLPHYISTPLSSAPHSSCFLFIFINSTPNMLSLQPLICSLFSCPLTHHDVNGPLMPCFFMFLDPCHLLFHLP